MHPALWKLLWLDWNSSLRQLFWVRRTWRQWVLFAFLVLFVVFFAGSQIISGWARQSAGELPQAARFGAGMPFWALLYLLATWLTAASDRGLVMRPADIHFLVSGPFRTSEIINLNLVRLTYRALISALVLASLGLAYVHSFLSALVGMWLLISTSLLVGILVSLAARLSLPAIVMWLRRLLTLVAISVLIALVTQSVQLANLRQESLVFSSLAAISSDTHLGKIVLPPIAWMFAPIRSDQFWPDVPTQVIMRIPILLGLCLAIHAVGGSFGEAATERTDRAILRRQSAQRSGFSSPANTFRHLRIPSFGYIGGIGAVAWVQLVQALRLLPRFLIYTTTVVSVILVVPTVMDRQRLEGLAGLCWLAGLTSYADFLVLLQMPLGFLGPVAHREVFKLLPIPTWRIVIGKLAGPALPLAVNHILTFILFWTILPHQRNELLQTALAMIPVAFVLIAAINLLGMWNVIRPRALQQRDALAAGRAMLSVWLFSMMMVPITFLAVVGAYCSSIVLGNYLGAYLLGGVAGIGVAITILILLLTRSYEAWQPVSGEARDEERELSQ